jgi:hypothetical protein
VTSLELETAETLADFELFVKFLKLEVSHEEIQKIIIHPERFVPERFSSFLDSWSDFTGISLPGEPREPHGILKNALNSRKFYLSAIKRDAVLAETLLRAMADRKAQRAIMVSGGFHTKGITGRLREKRVAYIVVAPLINGEENEGSYLRVMEKRRKKILPGEDFLAPWSSFMDSNFQKDVLAEILTERVRTDLSAGTGVSGRWLEKALREVREGYEKYLTEKKDPGAGKKLRRFDGFSLEIAG